VSFNTSSSPLLPTISTEPVSSIAANSAKSGGNITDDGGSLVIARGVCWGTSTEPDLTGDHTTDGGGTGAFISSIVGLDPNTLYYVRAYATNGSGTAYGNEVSFTSLDAGETVTDIDGNIYQTVVIGTQTWMAENLKTTHYANGDPIQQVSDLLDWASTSEGAYCYYDNNIANADTYGSLYNWFAVEDSRHICPAGWHVATNDEWNTLIDFAGGSEVAGARLREEGGIHWPSYTYGTNEYGFTALPYGGRESDGDFWNFGIRGEWWTSSRINNYSQFKSMNATSNGISNYSSYSKNPGYPVRCIKD
jgi:uncharacterized protein (TIGR02145 family)